MLTPQPPSRHHWATPAEIAAQLDGRTRGRQWRAKCPVHGGENPQSLGIAQGLDRYGNPCTLLYCYAHQCSIEEICAALGLTLCNLFAILPSYAHSTQSLPRTHSPRLAQIKANEDPPKDTVAQWLLEEMILSDPEWIETCAPARATLWRLAQTSSLSKNAFFQALQQAGLSPRVFWERLTHEQKAQTHGDTTEIPGSLGDADTRSGDCPVVG